MKQLIDISENHTFFFYKLRICNWRSSSATRRQLATTTDVFAAGASLIAAGIHLSYANVASQQARAKARSDFVKRSDRVDKSVSPTTCPKPSLITLNRSRSRNSTA